LKRLIPVLLVLFILLPSIAGCGSTTRKGARDLSTPATAFLGHWRNQKPGNAADIYVSAKTVQYAAKGAAASVTRDYNVIDQNAQAFTMTIEFVPGMDRVKVVFSASKNVMQFQPDRTPERLEYAYVDRRQTP